MARHLLWLIGLMGMAWAEEAWVFDGRQPLAGPGVTVNGAPRLTTEEGVSALDLDGASTSLTLARLPDQRLPARAISVAAWVKLRRSIKWGGLLGAVHDNGEDEHGWVLGYSDDRFTWALRGTGAGRLTYLPAAETLRLGTWHHVAGTYDGQTMRLYVDGKLSAESGDQSGDIDYTNVAALELGAYRDSDEYFPVDGLVAEVRLDATAWSAEQVAQRHAARPELRTAVPPTDPPPAGGGAVAKVLTSPRLGPITDTTATVTWETDVATRGAVAYAERLPLSRRAEGAAEARIHHVTVTGLSPSTTYVYRTLTRSGAAETPGDVLTFKTAPPVGAAVPVAFGVVGDNQTHADRWRRIADGVYSERPDFVLSVGDVVGDGLDKAAWSREWLEPAATLLARVPLWGAIGNHERNAPWFYEYNAYPAPGNYHSFDWGNLHVAVIDSNKNLAPNSEQYLWLDRDLGASRATWKLVLQHHPPYTSDVDDYGNSLEGSTTRGDLNARHLVPLFEKHGVAINFFGHIHDYERTWPILAGQADPRGVVYVQTGGAAGDLEDYAPTRSPWTAKVFRGHHRCHVTVFGGELRLTVHDIDGRLVDWLELRR